MAERKLEIVSSPSAQSLEALLEYWTEERIAKAIPIAPTPPSKEERERLAKIPLELSPGAPRTVEGSPGEVGGEPERANVEKRPFWNGGKLFFTKPDGKDYYGSAEFVGDKRVLLTAAHCVIDEYSKTPRWYKNFHFRRAYDNGGGQKVGWQCMAVWNLFFEYGRNLAYDYAFIHTNTDSGAGWLGMKSDVPYPSWTAIGYPKERDKGERMQRVDGTKGTVSGGLVEMLGNPMGGGCSGGAWIAELTIPHVGGNYAIGLNSFGESPNEYSPYFDGLTFDLYDYVREKKCM